LTLNAAAMMLAKDFLEIAVQHPLGIGLAAAHIQLNLSTSHAQATESLKEDT